MKFYNLLDSKEKNSYCKIKFTITISNDYLSNGFFNTPNRTIATKEPIISDTININGFVITGTTNKPPCGANVWHPKNIDSPPAIADPITHEGITLNGSAAAKGIAPSVIKEIPII